MSERVLMLGNEAIARGVWEAGAIFAAAYPGTPSTEILENIGRHYPEVRAQWCTNEKVAFDEAIGVSFAGGRAFVAVKHVGLNVASDPFMVFPYAGSIGGFVCVTADDPGMHSSQNEQDNRYYAKFGKVPCLEPSDGDEARRWIKKAYELSEQWESPVLLRTVTRLSHTRSAVELGERTEYPLKEHPKNFDRNVVPINRMKRRPVIEEKINKIKEFAEEYELNVIEEGDPNVGVIAGGVSYMYAREVFPEATYFKLGMMWPLPEKKLKAFCKRFKKVYVIEEGEPFLEENLRIFGIKNIIGKKKLPVIGEYSPEVLAQNLQKEKLPKAIKAKGKVLPRPPMLCAGCPHRGVFQAFKKERFYVHGDIGCYTLGAMPPFNAEHTVLCMGASIGMASGFTLTVPEEEKSKVCAVIGDSTFIHGGIPSLIDAVYNKIPVTVVILDNSTTGMTGQQNHPGTGKTIREEETHKIDIETVCRAVGVKKVVKVDPYDFKATREAVKEVGAYREGPSVLISERICVQLPEFKYAVHPIAVHDAEKCEQCLACDSIKCPYLAIDESKTPVINVALCVGCGMCVQLCKQEALSLVEREPSKV
ncbi:MAG: indolepyruvate ferredoxin oxidoreductase subunit alpha [Planctomycetota bacterium]|nr:MAG: indolepyruvate ferredoxin oxidoreductase subunit alpha [Planctomycetota bacterium]